MSDYDYNDDRAKRRRRIARKRKDKSKRRHGSDRRLERRGPPQKKRRRNESQNNKWSDYIEHDWELESADFSSKRQRNSNSTCPGQPIADNACGSGSDESCSSTGGGDNVLPEEE